MWFQLAHVHSAPLIIQFHSSFHLVSWNECEMDWFRWLHSPFAASIQLHFMNWMTCCALLSWIHWVEFNSCCVARATLLHHSALRFALAHCIAHSTAPFTHFTLQLLPFLQWLHSRRSFRNWSSYRTYVSFVSIAALIHSLFTQHSLACFQSNSICFKLTHRFVFVYNSWLAAYTVIILLISGNSFQPNQSQQINQLN